MPKHIKKIDGEALNKSIKEKNFKAAKKLIDGFLEQEPSREDKGQIYTETVSIYIDMINSMNESYLNQIKRTTEALKTIDLAEAEVNDSLKVIQVRKKLKSIIEEDDLE